MNDPESVTIDVIRAEGMAALYVDNEFSTEDYELDTYSLLEAIRERYVVRSTLYWLTGAGEDWLEEHDFTFPDLLTDIPEGYLIPIS